MLYIYSSISSYKDWQQRKSKHKNEKFKYKENNNYKEYQLPNYKA